MLLWTALACAPHPVNVAVLGATIGPTKADGRLWDGIGTVPKDVRDAAIAASRGGRPVAGITVGAAAWSNGMAPPDPAGTAWVVGARPVEVPAPGGWVLTAPSVELPENADTFTPAWTLVLPDLLLDKATMVRISLVDMDLTEEDPIATVNLDANTLRRALRARRPYVCDVTEMTGAQILSVTVDVTRAR